jgi:tetratricopeptide (TPR) repeat protein
MSSAEKELVQKSRARMRLYFILAAVLMFLMAILSSLGDAFIYIFSGLSFFFAFLGWQNWRDVERNSGDQHYDRSERKSGMSSFTEQMRSAFRGPASTAPIDNPVTANARKIILTAAAVIGAIFTLIIIIVAFSGNDEAMVTDFNQEGDDFYFQENYDSAYLMYRRGILEDENFVEGYYGIGNILAERKEYDSALFYYDRALQIDENKYEAAYGKAWVYYTQEQYEKSREELNYIFDRTDQFQAAFLMAGDSYYVATQYDSAIGYYETGYNLGARSKDLLNIMAYIYDVKGDKQKAISFYRETLEYDSTLVDVYRRLGELLPGEDGQYYRAKASGNQ